SGAGALRRSVESVLGKSRPHAAQPPGAGLGYAIPFGNFLSHTPTTDRGASFEGIIRESSPLRKTDRDADRSRGNVLPRRRLPPAVSGKTGTGELPHQGVAWPEQTDLN